MKYTVAYGDPFSGLSFYGVFDSFEDAEVWANDHDTLGYYIVGLEDAE